jgi:hypothetical protein
MVRVTPLHAIAGMERSRVIHQLIINLGARFGWLVNATLRLHYSRERDPALFAEEAGWAPGTVWTSMEKRKSLTPTGVRSPCSLLHTQSAAYISSVSPHSSATSSDSTYIVYYLQKIRR